MQTIRTPSVLRQMVQSIKARGKTIGFVPTMGALHQGHLSLIDIAKKQCDYCITSIFVNPKQFAAHEDFEGYPRDVATDLEVLKSKQVHIAFIPQGDVIYPEDFSIHIATGAIGQVLEGVSRPHFFDGVALIVTKLFHLVQPDVAVFGEKDYQQLHIIRQLVKDFNFPVNIVSGPIVREEDGLAMSSRNVYLVPMQRRVAPLLYRTLEKIRVFLLRDKPVNDVLAQAKKTLLEGGFTKVDYIEVRDAHTLAPLESLTSSARILAAAYLGNTRLLDNLYIEF